ncbi:hypothetical protein MAR_017810 [Mya arenaria]|uniref:Methyltransferase domain-containing protein n=1 Tax=Mya arenaria TaxID=6604 RepID=A0ABY7ECW2_MYAAR|nr:hypothetical protein MAR_017810 [Mya arenaria]
MYWSAQTHMFCSAQTHVSWATKTHIFCSAQTRMSWSDKTSHVLGSQNAHALRPIDVLKIDIEGDEWYTIQQMVSSGALNDVKQISMETHYMPGGKGNHSLSAAEQLYFLRQLYDNGFRIYMRERNLCCTKLWPGFNHNISTVNEISLIKLAQ